MLSVAARVAVLTLVLASAQWHVACVTEAVGMPRDGRGGASVAAAATTDGVKAYHPLVIAHRGASGVAPEHTLLSHRIALDHGADYLELDVQVSKDGELVILHSVDLREVTDVAQVFPQRERTVTFGCCGFHLNITGWFPEDFTWEELSRLRVRQRYQERGRHFDALLPLMRLQDYLVWISGEEKSRGIEQVGLYIETKLPAHYRRVGLPIEQRLLALLQMYQRDRVMLQSFEANLLTLNTTFPRIQLLGSATQVQLDTGIPFGQLYTPQMYAQLVRHGMLGCGPTKHMLFSSIHRRSDPRDEAEFPSFDQQWMRASEAAARHTQKHGPSDLRVVQAMHAAGLVVHPFTLRSDRHQWVPFDSFQAEVDAMMHLRVDGFFTDFPLDARQAVETWRSAELTLMQPPLQQPQRNRPIGAAVVVGVVLVAAVVIAAALYNLPRLSRVYAPLHEEAERSLGPHDRSASEGAELTAMATPAAASGPS